MDKKERKLALRRVNACLRESLFKIDDAAGNIQSVWVGEEGMTPYEKAEVSAIEKNISISKDKVSEAGTRLKNVISKIELEKAVELSKDIAIETNHTEVAFGRLIKKTKMLYEDELWGFELKEKGREAFDQIQVARKAFRKAVHSYQKIAKAVKADAEFYVWWDNEGDEYIWSKKRKNEEIQTWKNKNS